LHGAHEVKLLYWWNNHYADATTFEEILALATPV
jgi:hypothetical protein